MARQTVPAIGVPVPASRRFHVPWKEIGLGLIVVIVLAFLALGARELFSRVTSGDAPAPAQAVEQPVAQPVQPAPAVAPVIPVPAFRIHAEGSWVKIGTAQNGEEVMKLPIPWDRLVMLPVTPENRELWLEIGKLDRPDGRDGPGTGGFAGYLIQDNRITVYGMSSQDAHTISYWKKEVTIEGLSP